MSVYHVINNMKSVQHRGAPVWFYTEWKGEFYTKLTEKM